MVLCYRRKASQGTSYGAFSIESNGVRCQERGIFSGGLFFTGRCASASVGMLEDGNREVGKLPGDFQKSFTQAAMMDSKSVQRLARGKGSLSSAARVAIIMEKAYNRRAEDSLRDGGPGSGNFNHEGRPGEVGGSGSGGGGSSGSGGKSSAGASRPATPVKNKKVSSSVFVPALSAAKATCPPEKAWRVDSDRTPQDFDSEGIAVHTTEGGSTFAIKPDGDIISVCKNQETDKGTNARDLMAAAVEAGGTHLDSYAGNYEFYTKCGFEPVSRCKFDEQYAPPGWTKGRDAPEDIYFMRYVGVGKVSHMTRGEAEKSIPYSTDYDAAAQALEAAMKGK